MKQLKVIVLAFLIAAVSCTDISSLEHRLDHLESRVKAIERIIPSLNGNIEALQALVGGTVINSVEKDYMGYKLILASGEILYITEGSIGVSNPPLMSVDKNGYWMVDYQDGNGAVYVLMDGNKVMAVGEDGVTPQFGVDEEGFWTVSYDGGLTWEQVNDTEGKPVSALPDSSADEYFADVELKDDVFVLTLQNGETVSVPVVSDFLFTVNTMDEVVTFLPNETKTFVVVSRGVASASVVAKPEGFQVELTADELKIKAPLAVKASADTRTDVAVLAVSERGFASLSKVRVSLEITENINQ